MAQGDPYAAEFAKLLAERDAAGLARLGLATWASAGHDDAARSQITTVIVRGDREHAMVADCSDAIAERIPGSHCVLIPGADHMLPLRVPGRLAEIIADQAG